MKYNSTIVTACDSNYIWGAYLLIASLSYFKVKTYKKVLGIDLTDNEIELLQQFPDTEVVNSSRKSKINVCLMKPHAIKIAETDIIAWIDSDCIVSGDVTDFINVEPGHIQIRFRSEKENSGVYRDYYGRGDQVGKVPQKVLDIWKADVNDLSEANFSTVAETNSLVIHRDNLDFVELWEKHMGKVIIDNINQVYNKKSVGYFMTDESALNSLMFYSSQAPKPSDYLFDKDKNRYLVHFGLNPKPWIHWTTRALQTYDLTMNIIEWCNEMSYQTPSMPESLKLENKSREIFRAEMRNRYVTLRYQVATILHKILSKVRQ